VTTINLEGFDEKNTNRINTEVELGPQKKAMMKKRSDKGFKLKRSSILDEIKTHIKTNKNAIQGEKVTD